MEAWAGDLFFGWCIAVLLIDSRGWTRIVGAAAIARLLAREATRTEKVVTATGETLGDKSLLLPT